MGQVSHGSAKTKQAMRAERQPSEASVASRAAGYSAGGERLSRLVEASGETTLRDGLDG